LTDDDCVAAEGSPCTGGFVCVVPMVGGPFCCRRMCVCEDLVEGLLPHGRDIPAACDLTRPENTCPNLPSREMNEAVQP
jgi:hypothetical protein